MLFVGFVVQPEAHENAPAVTSRFGIVWPLEVGTVADACTFQPAELLPPVYATLLMIAKVFD